MSSSPKPLPRELTSYDFLKSFAVITMIIDHIGAYLFPEQNEWRMIGRMSMPVWFFLIGYARSRDLSPSLWIGGFVLVLSDIVIGGVVFPLNILFTILLARFLLNSIMKVFLKGRESGIFVIFLIVILVLPTGIFFDYGVSAFLFAMFGYLVRHQKELSILNLYILIFMGVTVIAHALFQQVAFNFNQSEALLSAAGLFLVCLYMTTFKLKLYPVFSRCLPSFLIDCVKLMGRHSLEIYVVHLLVIKAIAFSMFPEIYSWFQWSFF